MSKFRVRPIDPTSESGYRPADEPPRWGVTRFNEKTGERDLIVDNLKTLDEAKRYAAVSTWADHFDSWMTSVVEDNDAVEDIAEILGVLNDMGPEASNAENEKIYDDGIGQAVRLIPDGLRMLADRYEHEWGKAGLPV